MRALGLPLKTTLAAFALAAALCTAFVFAASSPAASAPGDDYPKNGLAFMTGNVRSPGSLYAGTNRCSGWQYSAMNDAASAIRKTTRNTAEFPDSRYRNGVSISLGCISEDIPAAGTVNQGQLSSNKFDKSNSWDFYVWWDSKQDGFKQPNGKFIGGRVHRRSATRAFCSAFGLTHPCGSRDVLQINEIRTDIKSYSSKRKHFVHEFVHPLGLTDCHRGTSNPSATANGLCGGRSQLDGQSWETGLQRDDRKVLADLYDHTFKSAGSASCAPGKVCLFKNSNFKGGVAAYSGSDSSYLNNTFDDCSSSCQLNNQVSAIANRGNTYNTRHFISPNHRGGCFFLGRGDDVVFGNDKFNNELSSHYWTSKTSC